VSVATVSNVLNDKDFVDPGIRSAVLQAAEQLNYVRPRRRDSAGRSFGSMIALISADVTDPVMSLIFKGMENVARLHGYTSILCDSENSLALEREHILSLIERGIDGMLIVPSGEALDCLGAVRASSCPFVIVDRKVPDPEASWVVSDNLEGGFQATKYLLSLGHRRVVFIAGRRSNSASEERYRGFLRAMEDHGAAVAQELIVQGEFDWTESYRGVEGLIRTRVPFSAVFAANDTMALAAKQALEDNGLRVPEDVSIVGYNDVLLASAISLTTVALDPLEMGKSSVLLLLDLIHARRRSPHQLVMPPRLVIRDSCRLVDSPVAGR